jgi:hypothetical protein
MEQQHIFVFSCTIDGTTEKFYKFYDSFITLSDTNS